ncbi:hypothetical protein [Flavobacterium sp. W21_SRS_FM6]|uniref:hypothetical protein n=1 Tax=Flavobacterium sp. W21_SRS_FM6 TaxID=3240268 RepID=UPI003F8E60FD
MYTTASSLPMPSSYEEEFMGFEIYIEPNPDKWREGFVWLVCKDGEEIDSGLEFGFDEAVAVARNLILAKF